MPGMGSLDKGEGSIDTPGGTSRRGFAVPATPDLELAGTVAASAEEQGYSSAWTNDAPPGDGLAMAGAMLAATIDHDSLGQPLFSEPSRGHPPGYDVLQSHRGHRQGPCV